MNSINVHISKLLGKIQEMSDKHVEFVKLSICDEAIDQNIYTPAFLHLEGYTGEGYVEDFESIDALNLYDKYSGQDRAG